MGGVSSFAVNVQGFQCSANKGKQLQPIDQGGFSVNFTHLHSGK